MIPEPLTAPESVKLATVASISEVVPAAAVMEFAKVRLAVLLSVPPESVTVPVPSEDAFGKRRVPALMVVPPLKVFAADVSRQVPVPDLIKAPLPGSL